MKYGKPYEIGKAYDIFLRKYEGTKIIRCVHNGLFFTIICPLGGIYHIALAIFHISDRKYIIFSPENISLGDAIIPNRISS